MDHSRICWGPLPKSLLRTCLALPILAVAWAFRVGLVRFLGPGSQFLPFYPAVVLATLWGGFAAGMLAALLGFGAECFWTLQARTSFAVLVTHGAYGIVALWTAALLEGRRQYSKRLAQALADLRRNNRGLEELEARHRNFVELAPHGVIVLDGQGRCLDANPAACGMTGRTLEGLLASPFEQWLHPEDRAAWTERFSSLEGKSRATGDFRHLEGGKVRWWSLTAVQMRHGEFLVLAEDITQRKGDEAAQAEARQYIGHINNSIQTGIVAYYADKRYRTWNPFMERLTGIAASEVLGKTPLELFPALAPYRLGEILDRALQGEVVGPIDLFYQSPKTGKPGWLSHSSAPLRDGKGEIIGVISTVTNDIAKRKESEIALRESEERFRCISSTIMDIAYSGSRRPGEAFHIDWMAGATESLLGRTIAEVMEVQTWGRFVVDDDRPLYQRHVVEVSPGANSTCMLRLQRSDGALVWFKSYAKCEASAEAKGSHKIFGALVDITVHKRAEEARQRLQEQALLHQQEMVQADKMVALGVLVSGVAHEINNPNGLLLMNLQILQQVCQEAMPILDAHDRTIGDWTLAGLPYGQLRSELPLLIEEMLGAAHRIKQTVNDLKDYGRREDSGRKSPQDLNEIVKVSIRLVDAAIRKATNQFFIDLDPGLPRIPCNPQRVEQIIINLLLNACQALPGRECGILVTSSYDPDQDAVVLVVRDEGVGIAPEHLSRIFDPFFTTKRDRGGTGLGLSVAAAIVKDYQGKLAIDSQPGQGTAATLTLPIHAREATG